MISSERMRIYFGELTPQYQKRLHAPLPAGFLLVTNPNRRRSLVHIVKADSLGALAARFIAGELVRTLCDNANVTVTWDFVPRQPDNGYLISCAVCRAALSHEDA